MMIALTEHQKLFIRLFFKNLLSIILYCTVIFLIGGFGTLLFTFSAMYFGEEITAYGTVVLVVILTFSIISFYKTKDDMVMKKIRDDRLMSIIKGSSK